MRAFLRFLPVVIAVGLGGGCDRTDGSKQETVSSSYAVRQAFSALTGAAMEKAEGAVSKNLRSDGPLRELATRDFLRKNDPPVAWPAVGRCRDGFGVLLGICTFDDREFFQLLGENDVPVLITRSQVAEQFVKVLVGQPKDYLETGVSGVKVSDWWFNAGLVTPYSRHVFEFRVKNDGSEDLIVCGVTSSCGCIVADLTHGEIIAPGDVFPVRGEITFGKATATRKTIALAVKRTATAVSYVHFVLIGNQVPSLEVSPSSLDFGKVPYGKSSLRRFVLRETEYDRFQVLNVSYDELPIDITCETTTSSSKLNFYSFDVAVDHSRLSNGSIEGRIVVQTTSRQLAEVEIPIRATPEPFVEVFPTTVFLGTRKVGEQAVQHISVRTQGNIAYEITKTTPIATPQGTVNVQRSHNGIELTFSPASAGKIDGVVTVDLRIAGRLESASIACIGEVVE